MVYLDFDKITAKDAKKLASIATGIPPRFFTIAYVGQAKLTSRKSQQAWFCEAFEFGIEINTDEILPYWVNDERKRVKMIEDYILKNKLEKPYLKKWAM